MPTQAHGIGVRRADDGALGRGPLLTVLGTGGGQILSEMPPRPPRSHTHDAAIGASVSECLLCVLRMAGKGAGLWGPEA